MNTNKKYKNKYRVESTRLKGWDYSNPGIYFITICTKNRECYFGNVENEKMILSRIGVIADILWYEIKNHNHHVELGEYVVMPNHIHGMIIINNKNNADVIGRDVACNDSTDTESNSEISKNEFMSRISPKSGSVVRIIGGYKSAVSKHAHRLGFEFQWQERFWDTIIRDEQSFENISEYIINNPGNWEKDKLFH